MSLTTLHSKLAWFSRLARSTRCPVERSILEARRVLIIRHILRSWRLAAAEKEASRELRELTGKWWVGNMRAMQAAGKPVYVLGRLVTSPI